MKAERARMPARVLMAGLSMLALGACHQRSADASGNVSVPETAATPSPAPAPTLPANLTADRIEPLSAVTPTPLPRTAPGEGMQVHRNFTDPALPAELNDDGGLKPLPPRPHPGG